MSNHTDFVIIGGGIQGLSIARAIYKKTPTAKINLFEKEAQVAQHASGRNSGVLHAGIYYAPNSLKARFCADGSRKMQDYCTEHRLSLAQTGKVIVATNEKELFALNQLYQNGCDNGANLSLITDEKLIFKSWPYLSRATRAVIFSPQTCVVDPTQIAKIILKELDTPNTKIRLRSAVTQIDPDKKILFVGSQEFHYGQLINAAGCFADQIAHMCRFGLQYKVIPFRGIYKKLIGPTQNKIHTNVYPVPDVSLPFLGIHFTKSVHGDTYIGPNALPAFGRENYSGFEGGNIPESIRNALRLGLKFIKNDQGIRPYAIKELRSLSRLKFTKEAQRLIPEVQASEIHKSTKVGIRSQLLDRSTNQLVMDFLYQRNGDQHHILNGVSPGFTCAFPFADYVVSQMEGL